MSANVITPLEGEATIPSVAPVKPKSATTKQLIAVGLLLASVLVVLSIAVTRYFAKSPDMPEKASSTPGVASAQAAPLKMPPPEASHASTPAGAASAPAGTAVPSLDANAEPIDVRRNGHASSTSARKVLSPDDAPIFPAGAAPDMHASTAPGTSSLSQQASTGDPVADAKASLANYKGQLNGMLENLQRMANAGVASADGRSPLAGVAPAAGQQAAQGQQGQAPNLFGSMDRSATPRAQARMLGDRSMILAKGTLMMCSLKTRVVSAISGLVGCQTTRNVFSDNGRVLLLERGSHLDGEYRIVSVRPGVTRIPVLWTRIRTPQGVTVDLDSPATGELGESGLGGYVDNRWGERLGAAVLLSLIQDAIKYASEPQDVTSGSTNFILPTTTAQGSKLAEKVLETTINIPPLLYQNQGGVVGVYVARDLDFSSVYELRPQ